MSYKRRIANSRPILFKYQTQQFNDKAAKYFLEVWPKELRPQACQMLSVDNLCWQWHKSNAELNNSNRLLHVGLISL